MTGINTELAGTKGGDEVNLHETLQALEAKGITVALDIEVHELCDIQSNCPVAIQLRRIIADTQIPMTDLLDGYAAINRDVLDPYQPFTPPEITADLTLHIAGQTFNIPYNQMFTAEVLEAMRLKLMDFQAYEQTLRSYAEGMFHFYKREVYRLQQTSVLPQLRVNTFEMYRAKVWYSATRDAYQVFAPVDYEPQEIINSGDRYRLSNSDKELCRRPGCWMMYRINGYSKRIEKASLLGRDLVKLEHYHGNSQEDCWGTIAMPTDPWQEDVRTITNLTRSLHHSLVTINFNSPMRVHPLDMPHINDILGRATLIGREGNLTRNREIIDAEAPREEAPRRRWGGA